jgi:hypothetical protein
MPSAYPKFPKWRRKNPGECFNAGFFRRLGYNFGICTYADYDSTSFNDVQILLTPHDSAKYAIFFVFMDDDMEPGEAIAELKDKEEWPEYLHDPVLPYAGKVFLVAISYYERLKSILCEIDVAIM